MLEGDNGIERNGDSEKTPLEPKAVKHTQLPTLRASG